MAHRVIKAFEQRISEDLDYDFDFTDFLGTDTISGVAVVANPSGLTVHDIAMTATKAKVWLKDGIINQDYIVTCTITSANTPARKKKLDLALQVRHD